MRALVEEAAMAEAGLVEEVAMAEVGWRFETEKARGGQGLEGPRDERGTRQTESGHMRVNQLRERASVAEAGRVAGGCGGR